MPKGFSMMMRSHDPSMSGSLDAPSFSPLQTCTDDPFKLCLQTSNLSQQGTTWSSQKPGDLEAGDGLAGTEVATQ